jgi:pyruvate/2-oxoglutarate dehydrogenase complex dihydrolipoamide dehydrogenase (E3) component
MDSFDVIVIGAGPAGDGEQCAYWGCLPSKTLIRPVRCGVVDPRPAQNALKGARAPTQGPHRSRRKQG